MVRTQFSHISINCVDPLAIERFYVKYFGFERARVYAPGPDQVVMLKSGNIYLELFKAAGKPPLASPTMDGYTFKGLRHYCFQVDDLDAKLQELGDQADISLGPLDMSEFIPGMRVCWIKDPEGNVVELNQGYQDEENPPPLPPG